MKQLNTTIIDKIGLHARPASEIVQISNKFTSEIKLLANGKEANCKSIIAIMALGVKEGSKVTFEANGSDEEAALNALVSQLKNTKVIE